MKDKQAKYPQLRFKGFTDPWEQRKLTDISEKVTEKNSDNEFSETLTNSAEYGIISQRDFFDKDISNEKNLNTYYVVRDGDFVYNPRISNFAPVGPIKRNTLGRTGVMSPLYYIFRAHNVDGMYLEKYFSSTKWHRFMELNGDTGARADRFAIKDKDFVQMPISLPNLEEQSKIARFLENVDNLIAANQRKLDLLKEQKKGYLQKMFPKNGAKVPELRFAGFADAWEQRKAAEIFKSISDKNHPELSVLSASQKLGMIHRDDIGIDIKYDKKSIAGYKRVEPGQFVIHLRSFQGGFAYANVEGITSPAYTVLDFVDKNENDPLFWRIVLTSTDFIKHLETVTYGIRDGRSISFADFSTLKFNVPTFEEQRTIGKFFKKIDLTITLHQRKLDLLKEQKKGFLQKMFV